MSAQIPETMLMSDLLKSTGYDCPEEIQGRTFAEATAGGDVQTNKASTIDVSAYTEPVVIKPDTDYESMQKNTVTLSNIPVAKTEIALEATENKTYTPEEGKVYNSVVVNVPVGVTVLYAWKNADAEEGSVYTTTLTPEVDDHVLKSRNDGTAITTGMTITEVGEGYINAHSGQAASKKYDRYSTGDIDLTTI